MQGIDIKNVSKTYKSGVVALNDLSLTINSGELFGLLGVNGAGKTTLIKILCGLTKKSSGKAYINGYDLDVDLNEIKKIIDVSPQETSVAPNLTVLENLEFFANVYGVNDSMYLEEIISTFSLEEVLRQKAKTLSGGYQRRLSIAIALISKPKVLFLDEPTLGLDVLARRELWKIILKLKGKITIILTSHYLEEIENLSDRVAILYKGKLLTVGSAKDIKESLNVPTFEEAFVKIVEGENE